MSVGVELNSANPARFSAGCLLFSGPAEAEVYEVDDCHLLEVAQPTSFCSADSAQQTCSEVHCRNSGIFGTAWYRILSIRGSRVCCREASRPLLAKNFFSAASHLLFLKRILCCIPGTAAAEMRTLKAAGGGHPIHGSGPAASVSLYLHPPRPSPRLVELPAPVPPLFMRLPSSAWACSILATRPWRTKSL